MDKRKFLMVMTMIVLVLSACSTLAFAKENQSEGQPFKEIWEALSAIQFSTEGLLEAILEAISGAVATLQTTSSDAVAAVQASISDAVETAQASISDAVATLQATSSDAVAAVQSSISGAVAAVQASISDAVEAAQASISDAVSAVQSSIEASQGVVVGAVSGARDDVLDGVEDSRDAVIDEVESSRDAVIDEVESSRDSILAELADKPKIFAKTATCTLKKEGDWGEIRISSSAPFVVKAIYVIPDRDYNNQFDLRWPTWRWSGGALSARPGDWTWTSLPVWFDGVVYDPGGGDRLRLPLRADR